MNRPSRCRASSLISARGAAGLAEQGEGAVDERRVAQAEVDVNLGNGGERSGGVALRVIGRSQQPLHSSRYSARVKREELVLAGEVAEMRRG